MLLKTVCFLLLLGAAGAAPLIAQVPDDGTAIPFRLENPGGEVDSVQVDLLLFRGELYLEEGELQTAARYFRTAVALDPEHLESRVLLARALTMALLDDKVAPDEEELIGGDTLAHWRWVLARVPEHPEALEAIRLLAAKFGNEETPPLESERGRVSWQAGDRAMQEGRYDDAAEAFGQAVRAEPEVAATHRALGDALRLGDRPAEAIAAYEEALARNSADYRAHTGLAMSLEAQADTAAAFVHFRRAFDLAPDFPPAADGLLRILAPRYPDRLPEEERRVLGRAYASAGDWARAEEVLLPVVDRSSGLASRKALAMALYFQNRPDDAIERFTALHRDFPEDLEILYYLGAAHLRAGHRDAGRGYLESVLEREPDHAGVLRLLGLSLSDEPGREQESLDYLLRAAALGAPVEELPCVIGTLQMRLENDEEARAAYEECLGEAPEFPPALFGLGVLADDRGDKGQAIIYLERYLNVAQEHPGVLIRLGVAYLRVGREEEGYARLHRILEIDDAFRPEDGEEAGPRDLLEMASFYLSTVRSFDDAIFIGEKLLALDPGNPVYMNNLAMAYADADRDAERAHELASKAVAADPGNLGHIDTLGWALLRLGRYEEAEARFLESIRLARDEARDDLSEIYYHLGYLYRLMNRDGEAETYLTRALENPPTPLIREEIEKLLDR